MDGHKSLGMGVSDSENLILDDEVFHGLSPLEFRYPKSSGINYDVDAAHLMDNPSEMPIHASLDSLPDPNLVYEGGISVGQASGFGFPNQEFVPTNSLSTPNYGIPVTSFSSLITQGISSASFPSQTAFELGSSNLPIQSMNPLNLSSQDMSRTSFSGFPTHEPNPLSFPGQGPSMMDPLSFLVSETCVNKLEFTNHNLPVMDTLNFPIQEMTSLGFSNQNTYMNTLDQTPPVSMPMENIGATEGMNVVSSSVSEQLQNKLDSNDSKGRGKAKVDRESELPLRQAISKDMISQYFYMPINDAAKALGIGVTSLKSRCRDLGFSRWPQRKLTSIQTTIAYLQEFGESSGIMIEGNVQERIMRLENERKRIEEPPDLLLEDDTLRLRQACFKSLHRKRKQSDRDI